MTEISRPFPGTSIGDAGPYGVRDWWDCWGAILRSGVRLGRSNDYNIGVFYAILNHLDPSISGANVDVDTGGAAVDGMYYESDAVTSISIPAASVNPRIDYIVIRKNYQIATDFNPGSGVPPVLRRETRLTVIRGTEAASPVAPSLTQDTASLTYWDIPIATVQVSAGGTLSNLVDKREYVDAEIKTFMVTACDKYPVTSPSYTVMSSYDGFETSAGTNTEVYGNFKIGDDFIKDATVSAISRPSSTANLSVGLKVAYGADGANFENTTHDSGYVTTAVTTSYNNVILATDLTSVNAGDFVAIKYYRNAGSVNDTVGLSYCPGFEVKYLAWKK